MRVCRVCLTTEKVGQFADIFADNCQTAFQLFDLFDITVNLLPNLVNIVLI